MRRYPGFSDDMAFLAKKSAAGAGTYTCTHEGCRVWIQGGPAGTRAHYATVHPDVELPATPAGAPQ